MSQLVINDLNFFQSELSELKVKGGGFQGGWLKISVDVSSLVVTDLPNGAGAGWGIAAGIGLGSGATATTWTWTGGA